MTDRTHPDSGRIITSGDVIAELHTRIAELEARIKTMAEEHADELMVAHMDGRMRAAQPAGAQQAPAQAAPELTETAVTAKNPAAPVSSFEDSRTQAVYEVLVNDNYPPAGSNEHWEGWKARLIVDALFPIEVPAAVDHDEALLEKLYWEFDSQRKKTGEERLAFKVKMRFYASEFLRRTDGKMTFAQSVSDDMMNLADRLGSEFDDVDPRAWKHLLVYAPKAAPMPDWLPFSKRMQIADRHGVKVTAEFNALVSDVIQTYLETHADRAARAPAESVTAPGGGVVAAGRFMDEAAERRSAQEGYENRIKRVSERNPHDEGMYSLGWWDRAWKAAAPTPPAQAADSVLEDAARESEYQRGYRHGYEQRDAEVRGALA